MKTILTHTTQPFNITNARNTTITKVSKKKLLKAYKAEVVEQRSNSENPQLGEDPKIYFPPPRNIFQTMNIEDSKAQGGWKNATRKEIKNLVSKGTFDKDVVPEPGEPVIDVMETNKIKLDQYGNLDKLKVRMCVSGDLQKKFTNDIEYRNSPASTYRMLRMFIGLAAQNIPLSIKVML